jgi:hypothetical protein
MIRACIVAPKVDNASPLLCFNSAKQRYNSLKQRLKLRKQRLKLWKQSLSLIRCTSYFQKTYILFYFDVHLIFV